MSPIRKQSNMLLILAPSLVLLLWGCSSQNSQNTLDPQTGKHPANWVQTHSANFLANPSQCYECHGADLHGGISNVSCFSASFGGVSCHVNGPGHANPATWALPAQHGAAAKAAPNSATMQGFSTCQLCHGSNFAGGSAQSCLNTAGCHGAGVLSPHPANWIPGQPGNIYTHTTTNQNNASVCALCHTAGANSPLGPLPPLPGIPPGCFNNTLCHGNVAPHQVPFTDPTLHGPAAKPDLTFCEGCHATPPNGGPGSNPRFNVAIGSLTAGCESSGCHNAQTAHPVPWRGLTPNETGHMTAGNMANACALCHGATLGGGVGPACTSCHTAGSPLTLTNCTSCHGNPPNGSAAPNIAGAHAVHLALGPYIVCDTCHTGAGTGTSNHANGTVDVAFQSAYNAQTGAGSYTAAALTCSNVSCHGGQTTPNWQTGAIDVNTQCTSCHASGTTQYNGYFSGEHSLHLSSGLPGGAAVCTDCHDTTATKLASVHFTDLNTTAMTQAWKTILNVRSYTGTGTGYGTCSNFTCHGQTHSNESW